MPLRQTLAGKKALLVLSVQAQKHKITKGMKNILYLKETTYVREIAKAISTCPGETLIILGTDEAAGRLVSNIKIDAPFPMPEVYVEKTQTRKPWRERPKF